MKALFLVESPFHITCAKEAIVKFKIDQAIFISHIQTNTENHRQIKEQNKYFDEMGFCLEIIATESVYGKSLDERICHYAKHLERLKSEAFDYVFFSDFRSMWQKDIISTLRNKETIMLDDGAATLAFAKFHWNNNILFSMPDNSGKERKDEAKKIKENLGINTKDVTCNDIKVFTIYSESFDRGERVIENELSWLKKEFNSTNEDADLILGAKIAGRGFMSFPEYSSFIGKIIENCQGEIVYYAPHRGQPKELTAKLLNEYKNLELLEIKKPIEQWLFESENPPARIHGYFSTAFYVINKCFKNIGVTCYHPPIEFFERLRGIETYGSNLYSNTDMAFLTLNNLPENIKRIGLDV